MPDAKLTRRRLGAAYGVLTVCSLLLAGKLVYLQIIEAPKLSALALKQRTREINLSSIRGEIVDRHGEELAISVKACSIYAHPTEFEDPPREIASKLAPVLGEDPQELLSRLSGTHWRWLIRQQDEKLGRAVQELGIPGIGVIQESKRVYPKGTLAAPLLGFVGVDNQGLAGIENSFDRVLSGPQKKLHVTVDAYGRELLRENNDSPLRTMLTDGSRVVLTIDENLQYIAERELLKSIREFKAKRGAVLVMDPRDGDLLALAVQPSYDPNHYEKANWDQIRNWAACDVYEPGSTLKLFTIAAALESKVITPNTYFACGRSLKIGNRTITDHDPPKTTRMMNPFDILEVSSNIGTVQIGRRMLPRQHFRLLRKFGFGEVTGSQIAGEAAGLMPKMPWKPITQATITFGQGISVTPLQLITASCPFANGGYGVQPRLIQKVTNPEGKLIEEYLPTSRGRVVSTETAQQVMAMLARVVDTGTGVEAAVPGYNVAGKTGTAQKIRDDGSGYSGNVISSFLGFAPVESPRLAILTILDSPQTIHWASSTAAPLFSKVAEGCLQSLRVKPTRPLSDKPRKDKKHEEL